jgi:hypothetical protein
MEEHQAVTVHHLVSGDSFSFDWSLPIATQHSAEIQKIEPAAGNLLGGEVINLDITAFGSAKLRVDDIHIQFDNTDGVVSTVQHLLQMNVTRITAITPPTDSAKLAVVTVSIAPGKSCHSKFLYMHPSPTVVLPSNGRFFSGFALGHQPMPVVLTVRNLSGVNSPADVEVAFGGERGEVARVKRDLSDAELIHVHVIPPNAPAAVCAQLGMGDFNEAKKIAHSGVEGRVRVLGAVRSSKRIDSGQPEAEAVFAFDYLGSVQALSAKFHGGDYRKVVFHFNMRAHSHAHTAQQTKRRRQRQQRQRQSKDVMVMEGDDEAEEIEESQLLCKVLFTPESMKLIDPSNDWKPVGVCSAGGTCTATNTDSTARCWWAEGHDEGRDQEHARDQAQQGRFLVVILGAQSQLVPGQVLHLRGGVIGVAPGAVSTGFSAPTDLPASRMTVGDDPFYNLPTAVISGPSYVGADTALVLEGWRYSTGHGLKYEWRCANDQWLDKALRRRELANNGKSSTFSGKVAADSVVVISAEEGDGAWIRPGRMAPYLVTLVTTDLLGRKSFSIATHYVRRADPSPADVLSVSIDAPPTMVVVEGHWLNLQSRAVSASTGSNASSVVYRWLLREVVGGDGEGSTGGGAVVAMGATLRLPTEGKGGKQYVARVQARNEAGVHIAEWAEAGYAKVHVQVIAEHVHEFIPRKLTTTTNVAAQARYAHTVPSHTAILRSIRDEAEAAETMNGHAHGSGRRLLATVAPGHSGRYSGRSLATVAPGHLLAQLKVVMDNAVLDVESGVLAQVTGTLAAVSKISAAFTVTPYNESDLVTTAALVKGLAEENIGLRMSEGVAQDLVTVMGNLLTSDILNRTIAAYGAPPSSKETRWVQDHLRTTFDHTRGVIRRWALDEAIAGEDPIVIDSENLDAGEAQLVLRKMRTADIPSMTISVGSVEVRDPQYTNGANTVMMPAAQWQLPVEALVNFPEEVNVMAYSMPQPYVGGGVFGFTSTEMFGFSIADSTEYESLPIPQTLDRPINLTLTVGIFNTSQFSDNSTVIRPGRYAACRYWDHDDSTWGLAPSPEAGAVGDYQYTDTQASYLTEAGAGVHPYIAPPSVTQMHGVDGSMYSLDDFDPTLAPTISPTAASAYDKNSTPAPTMSDAYIYHENTTSFTVFNRPGLSWMQPAPWDRFSGFSDTGPQVHCQFTGGGATVTNIEFALVDEVAPPTPAPPTPAPTLAPTSSPTLFPHIDWKITIDDVSFMRPRITKIANAAGIRAYDSLDATFFPPVVGIDLDPKLLVSCYTEAVRLVCNDTHVAKTGMDGPESGCVQNLTGKQFGEWDYEYGDRQMVPGADGGDTGSYCSRRNVKERRSTMAVLYSLKKVSDTKYTLTYRANWGANQSGKAYLQPLDILYNVSTKHREALWQANEVTKYKPLQSQVCASPIDPPRVRSCTHPDPHSSAHAPTLIPTRPLMHPP